MLDEEADNPTESETERQLDVVKSERMRRQLAKETSALALQKIVDLISVSQSGLVGVMRHGEEAITHSNMETRTHVGTSPLSSTTALQPQASEAKNATFEKMTADAEGCGLSVVQKLEKIVPELKADAPFWNQAKSVKGTSEGTLANKRSEARKPDGFGDEIADGTFGYHVPVNSKERGFVVWRLNKGKAYYQCDATGKHLIYPLDSLPDSLSPSLPH
ncbi:hypothetical protein [Rubripirellula amarantea]|uniref:hypothetical protein n=1 Tax=Rubripirellula amarantea TaxID=2527999 RepID=UPI0011B50141|nr:hypothetical protein [Rubripirellula amarantea]